MRTPLFVGLMFCVASLGGTHTTAAGAGYVALCSDLEGRYGAEYRRKFGESQQDRALADALQASASRLFPDDVVTILIRFNRSDEDGKAVEHDAIQLRGRDGVRFVEVAARPDATVHDPKPLARKLVVDELIRNQLLAAYIYFNELMNDDRTTHRASCAEDLRIQLGAAPGLFPNYARAFQDPRPPEPELMSRMRNAYARFVAAVPGLDRARRTITHRLVRRLGSAPPIMMLYHDVNATTGIERDVIRIGTASAHSYAIFTIAPKVKDRIDPAPLCLTGDARCGAYYEWP